MRGAVIYLTSFAATCWAGFRIADIIRGPDAPLGWLLFGLVLALIACGLTLACLPRNSTEINDDQPVTNSGRDHEARRHPVSHPADRPGWVLVDQRPAA